MKLTKETLIKIIKEELEAEKAESINPIELEKQLEPMVAAYLGGANNDASYQVIENFIAALMDLKSNGEQDLEEANSVNRTQATDKMVADYMAGRSQKQIDKDVAAAGKSQAKPTKRNSRYDGPAPLTMTSDDEFRSWKRNNTMYEGDDSILEAFSGATLEEGDLVCEGCLFEMLQESSCGCPDLMGEAEYQGRKVTLNKPTRGDVKKFKVYVKDPTTGNIKKVNFGHGGTSAKAKGEKTMKIRKNNPAARKSFRARHNCSSPGPKTKARYWSCKKW